MTRGRPPEPPPIVRLMMAAVQRHQAGQLDEADRMYRQVLAAEPDNPDALHLLGLIEHRREHNAEAMRLVERAVQLKPREATFHTNLGQVYRALGRADRAESAQRRAIELEPRLAEAHANLSSALCEQGRFEEAEAAARQALSLNPGLGSAQLNLGNALKGRGDPDGAIRAYQESARLGRAAEEVLVNIGDTLRTVGRYREARAALEESIRRNPGSILAHLNLSLVDLTEGHLPRGWAEAEWRLKRPGGAGHRFEQPLWDGRDLAGRAILLHAEQGLGDTIQFSRYAPMVEARGGRVILESPPILARLFASLAGVHQVVTRGESLPRFDVHAPLLSLPHLFATDLGSIPRAVPYLQPDPDLKRAWRQRVPVTPGVKNVGLAWAGSPIHTNDRNRSINAAELAPLTSVPNVRWFSLQVSKPARGAARPPAGLNLVDLTPDLSDFAESAAFVSNLDLLVTSDSAPAHLAGALGRPVWILLPHVADWRWLLDRTDSVWYPTARLFRQPRPGDWQSVIASVAEQLREQNSRL